MENEKISFREPQRESKFTNKERGARSASFKTTEQFEQLFNQIKRFNQETPKEINLTVKNDGSVKIKMAGTIHIIPVGKETLDQRLLRAFKILHSSAFKP